MKVSNCGWMGIIAWVGLLATAASADTELVNIPMDEQINIGLGDAIYPMYGSVLTFEPASPPTEPDGFARLHMVSGGGAGSWYYGPYVNFVYAGVPTANLDFSQAKLEIDVRFFQDPVSNSNPYGDAPIFLRIYTYDDEENYLGYRDYGIFYATQDPWSDPPYPDWTHKTVWLNNPAMNPYTEGDEFDITRVRRMRLYGTDWAGTGDDFIDAKKLVITDVPPPLTADAGPDQTFPDPACSTEVTFDGSGSTPPAAIVRYLWKEGETTVADSPDPITPAWLMSGVHTITLFVFDAQQNSDSDEMIVTIPDFPPMGLPVEFPMDQQVNNAITEGPLEFLDEGPGTEGFTRRLLTVDHGANGYYYGPYVNLDEACYGVVDLTPENMYLRFTARFYKENDPNYDDAPIFLRLRDTESRQREIGLLYQTAGWFENPAEPYPVWTRITTDMLTWDPGQSDPDFDLSQVVQIEFRGTDWGGTGNDFVDIKNLFIGILIPPTADAGEDQTHAGAGCAPIVQVTVDGSGSDPGGGTAIVRYVWSYNGDVLSDGLDPVLITMLQGAGKHYLTLTVYNDQELWDTDDVGITIGTAQPMPVEIAMDEQIDHGMGDAITYEDGAWYQAFANPEPPYEDWDYCRTYLNGDDWYFGPFVDLIKACYGTVDLSAPYTEVHFTARYFQDELNWNWAHPYGNEPYEDAPIFLTLRDAAGKGGCFGILYGPNLIGDPEQYPNWKTIETEIIIEPGYWTDPGFDSSKIWRIEFFGTDWGGLMYDFVDIKNLWIGVVPPTICAGDLNCDEWIDFGDINPFVLALSNWPAWLEQYPDCPPENADINGDGMYGGANGFGDINPFVDLLNSAPLPIECPP